MSATSTSESRKSIKKATVAAQSSSFQVPSKLARKKPALIALCIALALLGGLVTYFGMSGNGQTSVLIVKTAIQRGQAIKAADLGAISISNDSHIGSIPTSQSAAVIGKLATVDLPDGSVLTDKNTGRDLGVKSGTSIVGVGLTSVQAPSRPLQAGDKVRIIKTPTPGAAGADQNVVPISGTVDSTKFDDVKGVTVVDVVVSEADAANVVAWSAAGNAGLILDPLQSANSGQ